MKTSFYYKIMLVNTGLLCWAFVSTAQVNVQWDKTLRGGNPNLSASLVLAVDEVNEYPNAEISRNKMEENRGGSDYRNEKTFAMLTGEDRKTKVQSLQTQDCITAPEGVTGWWTGDGNANDLIGGRHAILRGDATTGTGYVSEAFVLDGEGDFVEVPDDPALNVGTEDFSVDFWVYFNTTSGEQVLVEKYIETLEGTRPGWTFTKLEGNTLYFGEGDDHGVFGFSPMIQDNIWIHLAIRRSSGIASIFVNGSEIASAPFMGDLSSSSSLKFGYRGGPNDTPGSVDNSGFYVNGRIDEVEFFVGKALSDEEILAIYNAGSNGKCRPSTDLSIMSFALVNAESDEELQEIQEGDTIDLATLSGSKFSIVTTTEPETIGSVAFRVEGLFVHGHTENNAPYALFGDQAGDFAGRLFPPGEYTLTATPYAEKNKAGAAGTPLTIHFTIIHSDEIEDSQVTAFDLYDAITDQKIMDLTDGAVIHTDELAHEELTVLMHTVPDFVGSVKVELQGPVNIIRIENTKPYALFRNNSKDLFGQALPAGEYHLKATPYTEANAQGEAGEPLEISFNITTDLALSTFTLVNAETEEDITEVENGSVIDLDALGDPALTLRANTVPDQVDSVLFELSGSSSEAIPWNEYQLVGDAFFTDGCYAVTPEAGDKKGAAWNKQQIDLSHSFAFTFTLNLCSGGDGMVFVLQQAGLSALGGQLDHHEGSELGYYYEPNDVFNPSIGIEIDIYNYDGYDPFFYYDPPEIGTHVTLVKHGNPSPITEVVEVSPPINNCQDRQLRVVWHSAEKKLEVYLDGEHKLSLTEDIVELVFGGDPVVYFGFTGATGGSYGLQTFCNTALIYDGPVTTVSVDHTWPYSLFGDTPDSPVDYLGQQWQSGEYTLTATPYRRGSAGMAKTIAFSVTGDGTEAASSVAVYPVPTTGVVYVTYEGVAAGARMMLQDDKGNVLLRQPLKTTQQLDLSTYKKGIYYLKVVDSEGVHLQRVVVE